MKPIVQRSLTPNATSSLNGPASAAPPVYRPNASPAVQQMKAPAVYRPGANQTQAKPAPVQSAKFAQSGPPVYRPTVASGAKYPAVSPPAVPSLRNPLQAKRGPAQPSVAVRPPAFVASPSLRPPTPVFATPPAVQRNKHKKRFLNVITFGIRKAYVNYKRNHQHAVVPVNIVPIQQPQQQNPRLSLKTAYDGSRKYHASKPHNVDSIVENGLLNYNDQIEVLGENVGGLSQISPEYRGDEKKGVFLGTRKFAKENTVTLGNTFVRTTLPIERSNKPISWWDEENQPTGPEDGRLFLDEKFRGGGLYTPASIHSDLIWSGKTSALLQKAEQGDPSALKKVKAMCLAIASHYPNPQPSWEEVQEALASAIDDGDISDEELGERND